MTHIRIAALAFLFCLSIAPAGRAQGQDRREAEELRRLYPPHVTAALLTGAIAAPAGFDDAIADELGAQRFAALRSGSRVDGLENDAAARCLRRLAVPPGSLSAPSDGPHGGPPESRKITVRKVDSSYPEADGKTSGSFRTGQDADLMLSGIDFNRTGGPLLFNHPMGIASDGTRLFLADTYNNRVLVWSALPDGDTPPDLVLGQPDFDSNEPGRGKDGLNWPTCVVSDGTRLLVADTENHRILIWNSVPTRNAQPADLVLQGGDSAESGGPAPVRFIWPWGLWTDGRRLAVSSTRGSSVLIWNEFPTRDDQPPSFTLTGGGALGTPRSITSDGDCLIVGDHNPRVPGRRVGSGTFVWTKFPTSADDSYDFFLGEPDGGHTGTWLRGTFLADRRLLLLGTRMYVFDGCPKSASPRPSLTVTGFDFRGGDHVSTVQAGDRLYVCAGNRNMILGYRSTPASAGAKPDFCVGSPDLETDTLQTHFVISNPVPASDGKSLFVASDFDRKLYVWKRLPDCSAASPDWVYSLDGGPWDIAIWKGRLLMAGQQTVWIWNALPTEGQLPDRVIRGRIGNTRLEDLRGIAMDDSHFYLSDGRQNRVHVWKGIPADDESPAFSLEVEQAWRVSSDGKYLAVGRMSGGSVYLYRVGELGSGVKPIVIGGRGKPGRPALFNMVPSAQVSHGRLFVPDVAWSRVHVWENVEDAIAGKPSDAILGDTDRSDTRPEIGRNKLYWPASVCFDGAYLWVGETKFSERLLRYSPGK